MAYRADIEIGVKGAERLAAFQKKLLDVNKILEVTNKTRDIFEMPLANLQNYTKNLKEAARALQLVEIGTEEETKAIQSYVRAAGEAATVRNRQNRLMNEEAAKLGLLTQKLREYNAAAAPARQVGSMAGAYLRPGEARLKGQTSSINPQAQIKAAAEEQVRQEQRIRAANNETIKVLERRAQIEEKIANVRSARIARERSAALRGSSGTQQQGPLAGPGSLGFPVALPGLSQAESRGLRIAKEKLEIIKRTVQRRKELGGLAANLQRLDNKAKVAIADANRSQVKLNDLKQKQLTTEELIRKEQVKQSIARRRAIVESTRAARLRGKEAAGSGIIGGAFPLLFGQGGAAAVGGAAGGLAGGLLGGQFGFALSLVGTALGQVVAEAEKFDKALAKVNAKAVSLGSNAQGTAQDVKDLAKALGVTKNEALELVSAFSEFESFADKEALASIFGSDPAALGRLAAAKTELDIAKEIFASRDKIGNSEAERLLNLLRIKDASAVELALAEARLQAAHDTTVEQARQVTFMDRLRQSVAAGFGGGVIDIESFGEERAQRLDAKFLEERQERLERFAAKLKEVRELIAGVDFFDLGKPEATVSGEGIEQSLRKQLARYEEIEPLARARAVIEADHQVTLERISKVKDAIKRKDLETLAGQVRQARLDDLAAKDAKKQADAEDRRIKTFRERLTAAESEGRILQASLNGREREQRLIEDIAQKTKGLSVAEAKLVEERLRSNDALRRQKEVMNELKTKVDEIGATFKNAFIDGIQAAIDGSKTLGQVLSDMLTRLSTQFLQMGANQIFGSAQKGTGLLGTIAGAFNFGGGGGGGGGGGLNLDLVDAYMAKGGPVKGGGSYVVGERGPELFVPRSSGTIVPNNAMGGSTNVVVNVDAKGTAAQGNDANADQLGRVIGAAVQAELIKQKRPGGLLTR